MPQYHEVQRVLTDYTHLQDALQSALEEASRNEGHKMVLKGFREEEHIDQASGRKTILVYAQFTPAMASPLDPSTLRAAPAALAPLNPLDLNDAASQNGENGVPRPSQLARGEGIPADQRFGAGQTSDITQEAERGAEDHPQSTTGPAGGALPL